jgi:hypothetical protein
MQKSQEEPRKSQKKKMQGVHALFFLENRRISAKLTKNG